MFAGVRIAVKFFFVRMVGRSLQASQEGIKRAQTALLGMGLTQQQLADRLNVTRQPIGKFFTGKSLRGDLFVEICKTLKLDWQEIAGMATVSTPLQEIDVLVQSIRENVRSFIHEQCGTMRVLDMTQPIELTGGQGIYTDVNILEKMTRLRQLGTAELIQQAGLEGFERFGLSGVVARVPGLEAVKQHRKLMVLGKPGAGKTTFLKFLAMSCLEGNVLNDKVPVFMALREFAEAEGKPSLMQFIERERIECNAQTLMSQGRGFLLFDGLDEVREEDQKRVIQQIQAFSNQYSQNQIVITCRIAAKEYTFQNFTEVEVADFSKEQIETFVRKWFGCKDPQGAEVVIAKLLKKLEENDRIQELASSPLLLTLLCLEFEESFDFPESRADLYERALKVLMSKWDASRKIERNQIYKRLSLKRKEDLLSQLALKTFTEGNYFFKQRTVEDYITDYIANLPDAKQDPDALLLDSEAVLKSIESQHGLLIERARRIYSFSHLTFQEFFAARQIKETRSDELLKQVAKQMTEKRWWEVFRLTVEMLPDADLLLRLMKAETDQILADDEKLQSFVTWLYEKARTIKPLYDESIVRALYFSWSLCSQDGAMGSALLEALGIGSDVSEGFFNAFQSDPTGFHEIAFDESLVWLLVHTMEWDYSFSDQIEGFLLDSIDSATNVEARQILSSIYEEFLVLSRDRKLGKALRKTLSKKLRNLMIEHRNIGHDWQFTNVQEVKLQQYYNANTLLVDCLNSDCYVSRSIRREIEETLLLPISEIEKRSQ